MADILSTDSLGPTMDDDTRDLEAILADLDADFWDWDDDLSDSSLLVPRRDVLDDLNSLAGVEKLGKLTSLESCNSLDSWESHSASDARALAEGDDALSRRCGKRKAASATGGQAKRLAPEEAPLGATGGLGEHRDAAPTSAAAATKMSDVDSAAQECAAARAGAKWLWDLDQLSPQVPWTRALLQEELPDAAPELIDYFCSPDVTIIDDAVLQHRRVKSPKSGKTTKKQQQRRQQQPSQPDVAADAHFIKTACDQLLRFAVRHGCVPPEDQGLWRPRLQRAMQFAWVLKAKEAFRKDVPLARGRLVPYRNTIQPVVAHALRWSAILAALLCWKGKTWCKHECFLNSGSPEFKAADDLFNDIVDGFAVLPGAGRRGRSGRSNGGGGDTGGAADTDAVGIDKKTLKNHVALVLGLSAKIPRRAGRPDTPVTGVGWYDDGGDGAVGAGVCFGPMLSAILFAANE